MNGVDRQLQESLKRRWDEEGGRYAVPFPARQLGLVVGGGYAARVTTAPPPPASSSSSKKPLGLSPFDDEMAPAVVPPVTVALEGRSICPRIHLHKHSGYDSLALELHRLFVDTDGGGCGGTGKLSLSDAVPGYIVAYEDMEDDLLLAGDLDWKDFVRVTKRIRILPAKASRRKQCGEAN